MESRMFAIKNHKIVGEVWTTPFTEERMNQYCKREGFDNWFYLDKEAALKIMQVKD